MSEPKLSLSRRGFLFSTGGAAPLLAPPAPAAPGNSAGPWDGPALVRKVYLAGRGRAGWPRPDVDLKQDIAEIEARLAELERRYPGQIAFTGGELLRDNPEASPYLEQIKQADAVLAFNMTTGANSILRKVVDAGRPTLLFARPYAGHDWTHCAAFAQKGFKADVLATSDYAELDPYVSLFRAIHHMRNSKVLLVSPPKSRPRADGYHEQFGTSFAYPSYLDLKAAYESVDPQRARKAAEEFARAAVRVVEPTVDEIADSMRLSLAIGNLLASERANAIAIDCLGGFGRGELPAYPCIAFSKLNDAGFYGVCECDLESTMTQLLVTPLSGNPGFVSDPVFDTSRNEVIHAHCVAATRMNGIGGPPSPFIVRSHLEDHKGVSLQVLTPAGGTVTVARFADPKTFLVSTGEATGNVDDERGCRTKIRTRVSDARKFLRQYSAVLNKGGAFPGTRDLLHRVVFYGNHVPAIERLACLTGFEVVHEI